MARNDLSIRIGADTRPLSTQLGGALKSLRRFGFRAESIGRDLTTRISLPLVALGGIAVKTFAEFDRLEKGLGALSGSAQGGADAFNRLNKIVLDTRTTLDLKTAALGEQRLVGAGLAAAEAERTIKQLGIAATVSGSSIDDIGGVIRQFNQIIGKGKIEQEDLNSILDRMPAIGALIKEEFGTQTAEGIRATGISMESFVSRLTTAIETNEKFQNVQGGLAKSFESFSNAVQVGIRPLGEAIAKALNLEQNLQRLGDFVGRVSQAFADLNPNVQKFIIFTGLAAAAVGPLTFGLGAIAKSIPLLISGFSLLGGPITSLVKGIGFLSSSLGLLFTGGSIGRAILLTKAINGLKVAFAVLTGPIGLAIAAIAVITIAIVKAYKNSEFFREQIARLGEAFSDIFGPIGTLITSIFPSLSDSFESVGSVFNFIFSGIAAVISAIIEKFLTIVDTVKAVFGIIDGIIKKDLGKILASTKEAFDLTLGGGAGRRVGEAFGTTFSQTLRGNLKKTLASQEVAEFASLLGGFAGPAELPQGIRAPEAAPQVRDRPEPTGSGERTTRGTPAAIQELNNAVTTLSDAGAKNIGEFFNEFVIGSSIVDRFQSRLAGLEVKPIEGLDRVERSKEVFGELSNFLRDDLSASFEETDAKSRFFGDGFDSLAEKIALTTAALQLAYEQGFLPTDEIVVQITEKLAGLRSESEAITLAFGEMSSSMEALQSISNKAFESVVQAMSKGASAAKAFGSAVVSAVRDAIKAEIQLAVVKQISSAFTSAPFPFNVAIAAAAGAGAGALFSSVLGSLNIPALADGGITTGAQLALIGEAGPEAVVPLPTLDALIQRAGGGGGGGGQVEFILSGENLRGLLNRSDSSYNRSF